MKTLLLSLLVSVGTYAQINPTACTPVDGTTGAGTPMAGTGAGTLATIINGCNANLAAAFGNAVNINTVYSHPPWLTGLLWSQTNFTSANLLSGIGAGAITPNYLSTSSLSLNGVTIGLGGTYTIPLGTWGSIAGTLSNQSDLGAALAAKQNSLGFTPLNAANSLSDITNPTAARGNLLLGAAATHGASITINGVSCFLDGTCSIATGGGGSSAWGTITGSLASQSDLAAALAAKQGTLTLTTTGSGAATLTGSTLNIPVGGGSGTVTSVGFTAPSWLAIANAPITTSGTIAMTSATGQTSHQVIGTCGTATTFAPCPLVAADIPSLPYQVPITVTTTGSSGPATLSGGTLNIPQYSGALLPSGAANLVVATPNGSSGASSLRALVAPDLPTIPSTQVSGLPTFPTGTIVGTSDTQTLTNKTVDGVSPATLGYLDATSSVQTQLNGKLSTGGNAATASALAATPTPCSTGQAPTGILANGNSTGCAAIGGGGVADPGANGIMKRTAANVTAPAVAGTDYVIPSGTVANATLAANSTAIGGIAVTGTPSAGYVPTATSGTAATWQAATGGTASGITLTLTDSTHALVTYYWPVQAGDITTTKSGSQTITFSSTAATGDTGYVSIGSGGTLNIGTTQVDSITCSSCTYTSGVTGYPQDVTHIGRLNILVNNTIGSVVQDYVGGAAPKTFSCVSGCTTTETSSAIQLTVPGAIHGIGASFSGATAGQTTYFTVPYACTISAWNMTVDTGTASVDMWKVATGTAIPTISNSITASATPAISTGNALHSTTLTGWTTSVSANDVFGINLKAVSGANLVSFTAQCQ